jgi:hypothetical protein
MFRHACIILLLALSCFAADFKNARVVDYQDASLIGGNTISGPTENGVSVSGTARVPSTILKCEVILELDGKRYSAIFPQDQHFQMTDLTRGQMIPVRLEGKKISMQRPYDGKEVKGKIVREESVAETDKKQQ